MSATGLRSQRSEWPRRLLSVVALVGMLVAAGLVRGTAPTDEGWQAPMEVRGEVGEPVAGRNISATVHGGAVAAVAESDDWVGETPGRWIAIEVSVEAVETEIGAMLGLAQLRVGEDRYGASSRPGLDSLERTPLSVGVPREGVLLFEVPESVTGRYAELMLAGSTDPRLDSVLVVPLALGDFEVVDTFRIEPPNWGSTR